MHLIAKIKATEIIRTDTDFVLPPKITTLLKILTFLS